ncbi:MAG TPA: SPOR domain-containing protein [Candidatus Atribacteria bacterium]|nr:SPOR domain-containing protein [Candidatus Atribacteria bacterium]
MSNPFAFLKRQDPVETIVILLGGLVVVVIAFFIARGDLDYYTEYLLSGGVFEREIEIKEVKVSPSPYFPLEEFLSQELSQELSSFPVPAEEEASPSPVVVTPVPREKEVALSQKAETPPRAVEALSGEFFVQCGAFSRPENAQKMVEVLKGFGYQAVSESVSGLYRVRIYGFQSRDEAEKAVAKLKGQGIESFVGK